MTQLAGAAPGAAREKRPASRGAHPGRFMTGRAAPPWSWERRSFSTIHKLASRMVDELLPKARGRPLLQLVEKIPIIGYTGHSS
jgi:hypothetical protein